MTIMQGWQERESLRIKGVDTLLGNEILFFFVFERLEWEGQFGKLGGRFQMIVAKHSNGKRWWEQIIIQLKQAGKRNHTEAHRKGGYEGGERREYDWGKGRRQRQLSVGHSRLICSCHNEGFPSSPPYLCCPPGCWCQTERLRGSRLGTVTSLVATLKWQRSSFTL